MCVYIKKKTEWVFFFSGVEKSSLCDIQFYFFRVKFWTDWLSLWGKIGLAKFFSLPRELRLNNWPFIKWLCQAEFRRSDSATGSNELLDFCARWRLFLRKLWWHFAPRLIGRNAALENSESLPKLIKSCAPVLSKKLLLWWWVFGLWHGSVSGGWLVGSSLREGHRKLICFCLHAACERVTPKWSIISIGERIVLINMGLFHCD